MDNKVSIIIPIYNCEEYIDKTIDSILNQTYKNIELILINDGSTDNSLNICNRYSKCENIKILSQNNFGAPSARNSGIQVSEGKYIMFFDSDDILFPTSVEKMVNEFKNNKELDMVYGKTIKIDKNGNEIGKKIDSYSIKTNYDNFFHLDPFPGNKMYKSKIIKDNNIFFGNVRIGQDLNFYLKYCIFTKKIKFIDEYISQYRILNNSISRTYNFKIFDIVESYNDVEKFYKKLGMFNQDLEKNFNSSKVFHYYSQLKKIINFKKIYERKLVLKYFLYHLKMPIKYNNMDKKELLKVKIKILYFRFKCYFTFK